MNKMAELAKLLGKELGEEFIAKYPEGGKTRCKFLENGFVTSDTGEEPWDINRYVLFDLFSGKCEIYNLPWKAKENEKYFRLSIRNGEIIPETVYEFNPRADRDTYNNGLMCKSLKHTEKLAQLLIKTARQFQGFDDEEEVWKK